MLRSRDDKTGNGSLNYGRYLHPGHDALIDAAAVETNPDKCRQIVAAALTERNDEVRNVSLRRQVISRTTRSNVNVVPLPDNWLPADRLLNDCPAGAG